MDLLCQDEGMIIYIQRGEKFISLFDPYYALGGSHIYAKTNCPEYSSIQARHKTTTTRCGQSAVTTTRSRSGTEYLDNRAEPWYNGSNGHERQQRYARRKIEISRTKAKLFIDKKFTKPLR